MKTPEQRLRERIQRIKELYEGGDFLALCTSEESERNFRRGWKKGYVAALDDLHELLSDERMKLQPAYLHLWNWAIGAGPVAEWVNMKAPHDWPPDPPPPKRNY